MTGVGVLALATASGVVWATTGSGDQYQPVSFAGEAPFMPPVGQDVPGLAPAPNAGGEHAGNTGALYAQNPDQPACDSAALLANLQADPVKAAAWGQVLGVSAPGIPAFVDSLTPVVLRAQTAVIDHGYRDGTFVARPAVLAPGTAVFINSYGEPTVKCYSGNPLTRGTSSDPAVTVVAPAATQIRVHTFVHPRNGGTITTPGKPDTKPNPGPNPTGPRGHGGDRQPRGDKPREQKPPLTGTWNYDGSITLTDGRIQLPNGTISSPNPSIPKGATPIPDGGFKAKDGKFLNHDGTERQRIQISTAPPRFVTPDGKHVDENGKEVPRLPTVFIKRNYDGTVSVIVNNSDGTFEIENHDQYGNFFALEAAPGQYDEKAGGIRTPPNGVIINLDLSPRKVAKLPGSGGTLGTDGSNTLPPKPAKAEDDTKLDEQRLDEPPAGNQAEPGVRIGEPGGPDSQPVDPDSTADPGKPVDPDKPVDPGTAGESGTGVDPDDATPGSSVGGSAAVVE